MRLKICGKIWYCLCRSNFKHKSSLKDHIKAFDLGHKSIDAIDCFREDQEDEHAIISDKELDPKSMKSSLQANSCWSLLSQQ